jgi:transcriptional regulator of acetoin/glycerol metabolism
LNGGRQLETRGVIAAQPSTVRALGLDPVDWDLIVTARHNVLFYGAADATTALLSTLRPHFPGPIHKWSADAEPSGRPCGTLILDSVATFSREQQWSLLKWLGTANRPVKVVSTTDRPLFELVQRGEFLTDLYYYLNTVFCDLNKLQ